MKSLFLFCAIVLGILIPEAQGFGFLIQYLLMLMLLVSFSGVTVTRTIFTRSIGLILLANIILGFLWYAAVLPFSRTFALIAFITAITPTATAAPAVMHFLKGKVGYVTAAVVATNMAIAALLPFFLFMLRAAPAGVPVWNPVEGVLIVIFVPLLLAQAIRAYVPDAADRISGCQTASFYAWVAVVFLAVARSSFFIRTHPEIPLSSLMVVASIVLMVCIVNFSVGWLIGGTMDAREASQSLGQKNTMFTVWYALTFLDPFIALGPVFYLIYHNIYNSYQMIRIERAIGRKERQ